MSSTSRRALILGGTGAMGGAAAKRLAERGWSVEVRGRESSGMPAGLIERGVRFHAVNRSDTVAISRLIGGGQTSPSQKATPPSLQPATELTRSLGRVTPRPRCLWSGRQWRADFPLPSSAPLRFTVNRCAMRSPAAAWSRCSPAPRRSVSPTGASASTISPPVPMPPLSSKRSQPHQVPASSTLPTRIR
jgi:hypothetical protein